MMTENLDQSDLLEELQNWYREHCDGDWEHQGGITIKNVDNPGWLITVDLNYLPPWEHENDRKFVEFTNEDELTVFYRRNDNTLQAFGGPGDLKRALSEVLKLLKTSE